MMIRASSFLTMALALALSHETQGQTCIESSRESCRIDGTSEEFSAPLFHACGVVSDPDALFRWNAARPGSGIAGLDDGLVTDRPDFTEASSVVGLGVLQLETGYTWTHDDDGTTTTRSHSYPETLFRYGILANWLEFRFAWNYTAENANSTTTRGAEDIYLGFKIGLTPQDGILPEMALMPQMTVPTGARAFSSDKTLAGLNWLYGWDITDCLSAAGSTQFNQAVDDVTGNDYTEWAQSWTFGYGLTERLGAYTEWYAFIPDGSDSHTVEHYFNGGLTIACHRDMQLDIRSGVGLNDAADDFFAGLGLSIRFQ